MKHRQIPFETAESQAIAADPGTSVWVSANAGSGKTHVLSRRVIRLLLTGVEPAKILCLTYTKAAAANMAKRVYDDLARWTGLSDDVLAAEIESLERRRPSTDKLRRARRLFAEALETPGGLKIQTIHAFCEAVLHQFPLEANIAGHFELLDQAVEQALLADVRRSIISGAGQPGQPALAAAFGAVLARAGEFGLDMLLGEVVGKRDSLRLFIAQLGRDQHGFPALFEEFGFAPAESTDSVAASVWPLPGFDAFAFEAFVHAAHAVDAGKVIDNILPAAVEAFAESNPQRRLRLLAKGFLKADGEPYAPGYFKKALCHRVPDLLERYATAAAAIKRTADHVALFLMLEATSAALIVAGRLIERYEEVKAARGFLDFNDLITRTVRLLSRDDVGPWVQYKLDQGIDHILIDEAQDTSPDQWEVVRRLAEEFFSGLGARDGVQRTIFAVGDEKQSIYSFQGADPTLFAENQHAFRKRVLDAEGAFEPVRLNWSFRSTDDILRAVDEVFAREPARKGLTRDPGPIEHKAIRGGAPGYVEIWPSIGASAVDEPDDWRKAIDHAKAPAVRLADAIAATIAEWIAKSEIIEGKGRAIAPGDVLVLVRRRDRFIHALSRALKRLGVAVAGADRLRLSGHLAVKDLAAIGRVALQPHDDLSLAALLRSPVFALTDEQLFALAHDRKAGVSLDRSLRSKAAGDLMLSGIVDCLDRWANEAAFKPVFDFYAGVLGRDRVRQRLMARLGPEAGDIIDEFLSFCLAQEKAGAPGLEALLATLDTASPEIKREMDQGRPEVRIMTAHAAKGLEAPVVFLVDNGNPPFIQQHMPRLLPFESSKGLWHGRGYLWRAVKEIKNEASAAVSALIRDAGEDEYRRLLYVGMTRAEDRLIVCGYHGKMQPPAGTWHSLVTSALAASAHAEALPDPLVHGATRHRFRTTPRGAEVRPAEREEPPAPIAAPAPSWLSEPVPPEAVLPRPLTPSRAAASISQALETTASPKSPVLEPDEPPFAIARGLAIHKLLQLLPGLPVAEREAAAERYLERAGRLWLPQDRDAAAASVMRVLNDPAFAPIFGDASRAEVGVAGTLTIGDAARSISGTVDRLAVTAAEVLIVDYKTNRPPPERLEEVPDAYIAQLALYRALLGPLYPDRSVRAALLFTEAPRLIALPEAALAAALARLTRA